MRKQRRLYQLGVSAGIVTMVLGALMAIAPVAGAQHGGDHQQDPRGNNGTVKIDGVHPLDGPGHGPGANDPGQHPDNDPHVECAFELEFFGFDAGQTANVRFTAHAPTGTGEILLEKREGISDDAAGGAALDPDVVIGYDLSDELSGFAPHDVHGWHVKLTLTLYNADGSAVPGGQKHKVFWIEPCVYEVGLDKTNDADADGTFTDSETADSAGDPVEFQVVIANTGTAEVTLTALTDTWPGQDGGPLDLLALEGLDCGDGVGLDVGSVLPAGSTTTCTYTVEGYAPAAGRSLTNTVVVAIEEGSGDEDTSTVTTDASYSIVLVKENDANGNEDFTDSEQASEESASVPFRIELRNTGTGDLTIDTLVDTWGESGQLDLLDADEVDLTCTRGEGEESVDLVDDPVLPAGSTTVCFFTVGDYAPPAGDSLVNTVAVTTDEGPNDDDTSTVSTPPVSPTFNVALEKLNDANGDGTFSEPEQAPAPGAAVTFQVSLGNTGTGHLTVASLVDEWLEEELDLLDPETGLSCTRGGLQVTLEVGSVLPAGSTTVCTFTVAGYAPAAAGSVTNTVTIETEETTPVADDSVVTSPGTAPTVQPTTTSYSVVVDKLNDADGDDGFGETETASEPGDDVEFELTIRNTGEGALVLKSLTDLVPGRGTIDLLGDDVDLACASGVTDLRVGSVLPVGSVTVCTFTLTDYAPEAGDSLTNTVTVSTDRAQDSDTSTVDVAEVDVVVLPAPPVENPPAAAPPAVTPPLQAPPQVLPEEVSQMPPLETSPQVLPDAVSRPSPDEAPQVLGDVVTRSLPRTGGETQGLAAMGAFLLVLGAGMVLGSRRQLARR